MMWLLIGMAVDGLTTLVIGIVLSLTLANPLMPHLPTLSLHHALASLRIAVSHWDHRA
jgi:hypothetical protein